MMCLIKKINYIAIVTIDGNYQIITLIPKKYCNIPPYLENCELFSLPPIFTNILYPYPLSYTIYLEKR